MKLSKKMDSRERFLTAIRGEVPDRVPLFEFPFSQQLQEVFIGYRTALYGGQEAVHMANTLGLDAVTVFLGGYCGIEFFETQGEEYIDDWGIVYKRKGWPIISQIQNPLQGRQDWNHYQMPDPQEKWRFRQLQDAVRANTQKKAIVCCIRGPVSVLSWFLFNIQSLSYNLIDDPGLVKEVCSAFIEWNLVLAQAASKIAPFDVFLIADDWGTSNGLLISPKYLKALFIKPFQQLVSGIKKLGYPVIMHNDGNIWEMLDDLVQTGIHAYHPVEKAATMHLKTIKERYGNQLCPIGNIDNKQILVNGTKEDVQQETLRCLREGAENGGYIISSDHSLHDDIPAENVWAYINTAKKYGFYQQGKLNLPCQRQ